MHYYSHHIDSYTSATRHLTPMEDLAYRRMLDVYYRDEQPLQGDARAIARRINLRDHAAEVQAVLEEFFTSTVDGWRQARCDHELLTYRQVVERNRANGVLGGRPRKPSGLPMGSQSEPSGNPLVTQSKPTGNPPNPNPIAAFAAAADAAPVGGWSPGLSLPPESSGDDCGTSTTTSPNAPSEQGAATTTPPATSSPRSGQAKAVPVPCPDDVEPGLWADWCAFRRTKRAPVTQRVIDSTRKTATAAGMSLSEALTYWMQQGHVGFFPPAAGASRQGGATFDRSGVIMKSAPPGYYSGPAVQDL